jgi:hypothetical protein
MTVCTSQHGELSHDRTGASRLPTVARVSCVGRQDYAPAIREEGSEISEGLASRCMVRKGVVARLGIE